MTKKDIKIIEQIITYLNELAIMTKNRDDHYFYDSYEMPILCELVDKIDKNINEISPKIKQKYAHINWTIIESKKHNDELFGPSLKLGKIWELASGLLKKELLNNLNELLEKELPPYYTNYSNKKHEIAMKESNGKQYIYKTNIKNDTTEKILVN